ncbi:calcium/proton exchanger, variant [Verruconis gallopava]|uniref:Calcium/proton exchanger, variant n=1 Tax=Verruconis gallopava TaxID=253628 RepID=A0A0D2ANJ5_9PEZI|nr:calcium/proton exchanger, variant [Verruconis gallopava]KIW08065.1 calcium/proton exchanger, variant [Verruconis gallopava]
MHRSRSWARSLTWAKPHKRSTTSPTQLPTTEPRLPRVSDEKQQHRNGPQPKQQPAAGNGGDIVEPGAQDEASASRPAATSPPVHTEADGEKPAAISGVDAQNSESKPPMPQRLKAGVVRFFNHTKNAIVHSWINVLLIFVPVGIAVKAVGLNPAVVFAMNAIAVVPLAGLLAHATESVASRLGDTLGALLNVSFGNAVELIIFIIALVKNEIRIVQASLLGSILANLLLILGMAFAAGGLRYQEQIYNNTVTQMSAVMLSLSVMSLLLPTAFHASFSDLSDADTKTLEVSRGTSVILLLVYILYLLFQLKSHAYLYASMPQALVDEEAQPGILADVFETSSSSSSSTSSSDTDTTSGSHTTAKRIKRFIRKRRKSSGSSADTPSLPSHMSSPNIEAMSSPSYFDDHGRPSRQTSVVLPDILSGDEGDDENLKQATKTQDFGNTHGTGSNSLSSESKSRRTSKRVKKNEHKKHRKHHRHQHRTVEAAEPIPEKPSAEAPGQEGAVLADITAPGVGLSNDGTPARIGTPNSRKGGIKTFARPALPKLLSQNVFVDPPPPPTPHNLTKTRTGPALRRTSSLPDRLNERFRNTPGNRQLPMGRITVGRPLPPYAARGAWAARAKPDVPAVSAVDEDEPIVAEDMSRTAAVVMLLITTGLVALCAEFLVDAIPQMTTDSAVSQAFIGLIILPIVGNAAEHVTAVTVAAKNKMDLAIGVAVGSSIQIALFITPLVVILGWCMDKSMSLYFNLFETVSLFVTAFVVNFLVLDGKSNYLEGVLLIAAYIIIAVAAFFYPPGDAESALGGSNTDNSKRAVDAFMLARDAFGV